MAENFYQPGDLPSKLDHDDLNFLRCLRLKQEESDGGLFSEAPPPSPDEPRRRRKDGCRSAFNGAQKNVIRCDVVGISKEFAKSPTTSYQAQVMKENPLLLAEEYDEEKHGCNFAIVEEGAGPGCTIEVCMCGLFQAIVEMVNPEHCYAKPQNGTNVFISTDECTCAVIKSRSEIINDKALAQLKFFDKCDDTCDCGFPKNSIHCGVVKSIAGTVATIEATNPDGDLEEYEVQIKGGGLPEIDSEAVFFVGNNCEKFMQCKVNICPYPELFTCENPELFDVDLLSSITDFEERETKHRFTVRCLADDALGTNPDNEEDEDGFLSIFCVTLPCDEEFCSEEPLEVNFSGAAACSSFEMNYGNNDGCCLCTPFYCLEEFKRTHGFEITVVEKSSVIGSTTATRTICITNVDTGEEVEVEYSHNCPEFCLDVTFSIGGQDVSIRVGSDECCCRICFDCESDFTATFDGFINGPLQFQNINGVQFTLTHPNQNQFFVPGPPGIPSTSCLAGYREEVIANALSWAVSGVPGFNATWGVSIVSLVFSQTYGWIITISVCAEDPFNPLEFDCSANTGQQTFRFTLVDPEFDDCTGALKFPVTGQFDGIQAAFPHQPAFYGYDPANPPTVTIECND